MATFSSALEQAEIRNETGKRAGMATFSSFIPI